MNIERGDLFVVSRGYEMGRLPSFATIFGGESQQEEKPSYDRSHEGKVFRALEVCGPVIAAEVIYDGCIWREGKTGQRLPINTLEVEVWPVTDQYLAALTEQR